VHAHILNNIPRTAFVHIFYICIHIYYYYYYNVRKNNNNNNTINKNGVPARI